jgi:hypothetical protein
VETRNSVKTIETNLYEFQFKFYWPTFLILIKLKQAYVITTLSVCLRVYVSPINFRMPEPVFMKLGMYIMAPESISTAYFMNPSHHVSICVTPYSC